MQNQYIKKKTTNFLVVFIGNLLIEIEYQYWSIA